MAEDNWRWDGDTFIEDDSDLDPDGDVEFNDLTLRDLIGDEDDGLDLDDDERYLDMAGQLLMFDYSSLKSRIEKLEKAKSGNGWVYGPDGKRRWGRYGAAGVLLRHVDSLGTPRFMLARRSLKVAQGGTWSFPGGALNRGEHSLLGALREMEEEIGRKIEGYKIIARHVYQPIKEWSYTTWVIDLPHQLFFALPNWETTAVGWFTIAQMREMDLHSSFRKTFFSHDGWEDLRGVEIDVSNQEVQDEPKKPRGGSKPTLMSRAQYRRPKPKRVATVRPRRETPQPDLGLTEPVDEERMMADDGVGVRVFS